eukprot:TRINITY_DN34905_c0_g1_i1.p1 TRINITY_DN34905_c0_g1~~TRINITY_DN34905_c0_g1_i1.p1  ORF type:complete len:148 (+),score=13.38 TRINITY_DN34905_c0_g1_i1:97-540(+)
MDSKGERSLSPRKKITAPRFIAIALDGDSSESPTRRGRGESNMSSSSTLPRRGEGTMSSASTPRRENGKEASNYRIEDALTALPANMDIMRLSNPSSSHFKAIFDANRRQVQSTAERVHTDGIVRVQCRVCGECHDCKPGGSSGHSH